MTTRLHLNDSWLHQFEATVTAHGQWRGRPSLCLDASAFYPESGGQMADRGSLRTCTSGPADGCEGGAAITAVVDVQLAEDGAVHHLVAGERPALGARVVGKIDGHRRRIHMAQHTGQHILSRALREVLGADTVSSRLGERACTIDTDQPLLHDDALARAEALANTIIDDDVAVQVLYPDAQQLAAMPLRRPAKVKNNVRIIKIGDFDVTPCGGTHCSSSAQVGLLRLLQVVRHKGGSRVTFAAGSRARVILNKHSQVAGQLAQRLSCRVDELVGAFDKLQQQSQHMRRALTATRERLVLALSARFGEQAKGPLWVMAFDDVDVQVVRRLASKLCAGRQCAMALAANSEEGVHVVIARSADREVDCGELMKRLAAAGGGRGGGRPERAEGKLPAGTDWPALVARVVAGDGG